jgi:hypothetical protein
MVATHRVQNQTLVGVQDILEAVSREERTANSACSAAFRGRVAFRKTRATSAQHLQERRSDGLARSPRHLNQAETCFWAAHETPIDMMR